MEILKNLIRVSKEQLLKDFSLAVIREREVISEVVAFIAEIGKRKLYAEAGYSSLFSFLTEKYHYSEGAAYRRIQAAKVYQKFPEVLELLKQGKLNLMTLSLIEPHLDQKNGSILIHKILDKSKREVEEVLSELSLKKEKTQDSIRRLPLKKASLEQTAQNFTFTGESDLNKKDTEVDASQKGEKTSPGTSIEMSFSPSGTAINQVQEIRKVKIEFVADENVAKLIERAKELLRHKYPQGKLEDLVREAFELLLEKKDPERKIQRQEKKEILRFAQNDQNSRYIPQHLQREIFKRDEGQCTYMSPEGKLCGEKSFLELDHVKPWALGGVSKAENLRLLCRTHNQWRSEKTFGFIKN